MKGAELKAKVDGQLAVISTWTVSTVALLAAVLSFHNITEFAVLIGVPAYLAPAYPLFIDGMLLASSLAVLRYARRGERSWLAVSVLAFGVLNSIFTNSFIVWGDGVAMYGHALPPIALFLTVELLVKGYKVSLTDKEKEAIRAERAERKKKEPQPTTKAVREPAKTAETPSPVAAKTAENPSNVVSIGNPELRALVKEAQEQNLSQAATVRLIYSHFDYPALPHNEVGKALGIPTKTVGVYRRRSLKSAS